MQYKYYNILHAAEVEAGTRSVISEPNFTEPSRYVCVNTTI